MLAARPVRKHRAKPGERLAKMRSQQTERLEFLGYVIPFHPMIGHNLGPGLFDWDRLERRQMKEAHSAAWAGPSQETALGRFKKAQELGVSYRDYVLEILERGRYL
jgi:hypothetical protein